MAKVRKRIKHRLALLFADITIPLLASLPRPWRMYLATLLGSCVFKFSRRERVNMIDNLSLAFPEKDKNAVRDIARRCFIHFARMIFDTLCVSPKQIDALFTGDSLDKVSDLLEKEGRGAILLTAHFGNWELLGARLCQQGLNVSTIARRLNIKVFNERIVRLRERFNLKVIYQEDDVRKSIRALKSNQCLGILPDQDIERMEGVFVPFMGRDAHTPIGPVVLASMTGAPIVPVFVVMENDQYRLITCDPIHVPLGVKKDIEGLKSYTRLWTEQLEAMVYKYPEQWAWMHKRWKTSFEQEGNNTQ